MRRAALLAVVLVGALPALAAAAERRASLPDIEDEVMCLQCGTALNLSTAPVAERERAFIRREISRGRTKQQIKDAPEFDKSAGYDAYRDRASEYYGPMM